MYRCKAAVVSSSGALDDLDQAVALSGGAGPTARQALVQRGLLHRLTCRDDEARKDFQRAAALGSEFARQQVVALNPYAALCNKMLSQVINKLRNPDVSEPESTAGTEFWSVLSSINICWSTEWMRPTASQVYYVMLRDRSPLPHDTCCMFTNRPHRDQSSNLRDTSSFSPQEVSLTSFILFYFSPQEAANII